MAHLPRSACLLGVALAAVSCDSKSPVGPSQTTQSSQFQRTVSGTVSDPALRPLAGVRVSFVGTSRSVMTDDEGRYELSANIASPATVRVEKQGYASESRQAHWLQSCPPAPTSCAILTHLEMFFFLRGQLPPVNVQGEYAVTVTADTSCADLPLSARSRSYTAGIYNFSPASGSFAFEFFDATVIYTDLNFFGGGTTNDHLTVQLTRGGAPDTPVMYESIATNTYVTLFGTIGGPVATGISTITASLDGVVAFCALKAPISGADLQDCGTPATRLDPTPSQPVTFSACRSKDHRVVLTRR